MDGGRKLRVKAQLELCKSVVDNTTDFLTSYLKDEDQTLSDKWEVANKYDEMGLVPMEVMDEVFGEERMCWTCKTMSRSKLMWRTNHRYFCGPTCEDIFIEKCS